MVTLALPALQLAALAGCLVPGLGIRPRVFARLISPRRGASTPTFIVRTTVLEGKPVREQRRGGQRTACAPAE
jgi:hypothetical protein